MGNENLHNRETSLTPELLATINAATSAAVKEAIAGMSAMMADVVKSVSLTPEKLREANKPYVDPDKERREIREKMKFRKDEEDSAKQTRLRQEACLHQDQNGRSSLQVVHNFLDRQPRGICALCQVLVYPREWRIGPPTEKHPDGEAYLVSPHPAYGVVMQLDQRQ
jgi:hypothetical protein